ncbi:hypothetical protein NDU88_001354 [Pleurodeles waltl]|uniref:Uncharacterized protein n=1 Tax=Pleurodeles waltl TaxID=8319 RepID=A0AAV7V7Z5_PLEWA|nr:hypothetical protein NDU88_001354 [Pleurodeles waltl]
MAAPYRLSRRRYWETPKNLYFILPGESQNARGWPSGPVVRTGIRGGSEGSCSNGDGPRRNIWEDKELQGMVQHQTQAQFRESKGAIHIPHPVGPQSVSYGSNP